MHFYIPLKFSDPSQIEWVHMLKLDQGKPTSIFLPVEFSPSRSVIGNVRALHINENGFVGLLECKSAYAKLERSPTKKVDEKKRFRLLTESCIESTIGKVYDAPVDGGIPIYSTSLLFYPVRSNVLAYCGYIKREDVYKWLYINNQLDYLNSDLEPYPPISMEGFAKIANSSIYKVQGYSPPNSVEFKRALKEAQEILEGNRYEI